MIKSISMLILPCLALLCIILLSACSATKQKQQKVLTPPPQPPGSQSIIVDRNNDFIIYQDEKLTIKGPKGRNARRWCRSGQGANMPPLIISAHYKVDHFERGPLFPPSYALFIQQNILPPITFYCSLTPRLVQLEMMDAQNKYQFWDALTFSVVRGQVTGRGYTPPSPSKTGSLDQKKLEAYVKNMTAMQNDEKQYQVWLKEKDPDKPAGNAKMLSYKSMSSYTDAMTCDKNMNLYIQTVHASLYEGDRKDLQKLVNAERDRQKECPAFEKFTIHGTLDNKWYFRGTSAKAENWKIKGQIIKNDDKYLEPYMFPEAPDDKYKLGLMYLSGDRLAVNYYQGVMNIKSAAEDGYADAQYTFGIFYEEGRLIQKDKVHALKWVKKAADQGHKKAIQYLRQQKENEKLALKAEKLARKKGIVYKSGRFWQEFSNFDIFRKVFEGNLSGSRSSMVFKNNYIDFLVTYSGTCRKYLPSVVDRRTYITTEITREGGFETSRREKSRTDIYIDPRFTDAFDQYQQDVKGYNSAKTIKAIIRMRENMPKQGFSDSIRDAAYDLEIFEMRDFFNKVRCDSATMYQVKENMLRAATRAPSLQASGVVIKNAEQESDSVEASARMMTFEQACHKHHSRLGLDERNTWCSCLNQEARRVMTAAELNRFADNFRSYYTEIDRQDKGPDDPRWRLQGPLNKCRH